MSKNSVEEERWCRYEAASRASDGTFICSQEQKNAKHSVEKNRQIKIEK